MTELTPTWVMLDTNIYDAVASQPALSTLMSAAQASGHIVVRTTRVQHGELAKIPPERDMGQASAVRAERVPLSVFILDYGILDEDHLGCEQANQAFDAVHGGKAKHFEDALIAATAAL